MEAHGVTKSSCTYLDEIFKAFRLRYWYFLNIILSKHIHMQLKQLFADQLMYVSKRREIDSRTYVLPNSVILAAFMVFGKPSILTD